MFVGDVEVIQLPENLALASTVRLHPANEFFGGCAYATEEPGRPVPRQARFIPSNWEIGFTQDVLPDCGVGPFNESNCKTIQCAPKIVDNVSDISAEISRNIFQDSNAIDFYTGFRLFIEGEILRISMLEPLHRLYEVVKVFVGPIDLYPATEQRITVHGKA
jgi:hypothetical protein